MLVDIYNKILCNFISKEIKVEHKNKVIKTGILNDWKCHPFFLELFMTTTKGEEKLKLFYPFDSEEHNSDSLDQSELYLDYRVSTFNSRLGLGLNFYDVDSFGYHKYLNSIVTILEI